MAAVNFPQPNASNPETGDIYANGWYNEENGVTYTYADNTWSAASTADLSQFFVDIDGDTMTGDLTVPSLNGGPLAGFRNQIINGDLTVSQRFGFNAYQTGVNTTYTADRWFLYLTGAGTADVRTRTKNQMWATAAAEGLSGSLQVTNATTGYSIRQAIELQTAGTAGVFVEGSTWTVSVYSQVTPSVNVSWSNGTQPGSTNFKNIVQQPTMVSEGNDRYSHTFTIGAADSPLADSNC